MYAIFRNFREPETFKCDGCSRVSKKAWSDDEAIAEMRKKYGKFDASETLVFCDDCLNLCNLNLK